MVFSHTTECTVYISCTGCQLFYCNNLKVPFRISFKLALLQTLNEVIPVSTYGLWLCVEVEIVVQVYQTNNQSRYILRVLLILFGVLLILDLD